jgi:cobalt-zinc-cadmium efflux system protein
MTERTTTAPHDEIGPLRVAALSALAVLAVELAGAALSHSLALLTDAAHMATDGISACLAWWAARVALRHPDERRTFGYGRATVLAALFNASALFAVVLLIVITAIRRLFAPAQIGAETMLATAAFGVIVNGGVSWYLLRARAASLNARAVVAHLAGDALISAGVIVAAVLIAWRGWLLADPLVAIGASGVVAYAAWGLVRDAIDVLMESVPRHLDVGRVRDTVALSEARILDVHDVHLWSVSDRRVAASLHVRLPESALGDGPRIVEQVKVMLQDRFGIAHATIEVECDDCARDCP